MPSLPAMMLRILLSKRGWHSFHSLVKADTFTNTEFRRIYTHLEQLHDSTESDIPVEAVKSSLEIQFENRPDIMAETLMALETVAAADEVPQDLAERLVRKYLERSTSFEIAEYVANNADKEDFSLSTVEALAQRAVEAGNRVQTVITDVLTAEVSGAPNTRPVRYPTGVSRQLDTRLRGGTGNGELFIYLAPPSRGKTAYLCKTGATAAKRGLGVLHITLEINTRKVVERYDQCWTALSTEDLATPDGQEAVQTARQLVKEKGGNVWVVDWSYQNVCAFDIGGLVRRMESQGMYPNMIIVDYMELMAPNKTPGREMRQAYAAIGKECRSLAVNLDVPFVTAWQANRGGNDTLLLSPSDVSESWDIIKIADTILGLNQTLPELQNKRMRVNIIKQRESTDRTYVEIYSDLDRMIVRDISVHEHIEEVRDVLKEKADGAGPADGEPNGDTDAGEVPSVPEGV